MFSHLDHLNLHIANFDATVDWYQRVLGFQIVEADFRGQMRWCVLRHGQAMLCVYDDPPSADLEDAGVGHFALRVTDLEALEAQLAKHDVQLSYGDGPIDYPHSVSRYVTDPSGMEIELVVWDQDQVSFQDRPMRW